MNNGRLAFLAAAISLISAMAHAETTITWKRQQLHGDFYSEGAAIGDINGDGKPDIVAGPFWFEGPTFEKKHAYYEPKIFNINGYSDNFFAYVYDFNGDKKNDILILGFPGKEARLYLNPGTNDDKPWPMSIVADVVDNESPVFTDITGDGKPEIVCSTGGKFGYFEPDWTKPTEKWKFVAVTDDQKVAKFTHGLGVGDVDGDGKMDLLEARHWWKHTASGMWEQHSFGAGIGGGAQMFAYDFDGNGLNDIFTSLQAHRYGVATFLQQKPAEGQPGWKRMMMASENPADNDYGIVFSQPHAAALADINGDGVMDIVVGKRYWAHNGHDPDEHGARVVYWYETKRDGKGGVDFIPHLVDAASGVGVDVTVGDVNGDGLPDIVTANKAGVFVLTQQRQEVAKTPEPVKMYGPGLKPQTEYAHGQSPAEALKSIQLPTGFKAELIAAEPDIVQPIAFTFDERGRIWVLEGLSYPQPRKEGEGQDRIVILEDKDGDGTYETKKVFCEGINLGSGIEVGFGGVWVGAAPYLMFIPRDGDKPGEPANLKSPISNLQFSKVPGLNFTAYALLDGFGSQDTHETLNSFIWGPDGWLYGCHGVFTHSKIGKPGTPDEQRVPFNAGVWRYHPVRHQFEAFAQGTSNPWGLDYDQNGEFFVTACVIPHLYHIVPGARYQRQGGQHFNPYTYDDIKTIADHAHYAGNIRDNAHWGGRDAGAIVQDDTNSAGGGHAHCGLAIYQSDQFPPDYRNKLIFGNLHGHRLVSDYLDPQGSSFIGKHGGDFMRSNDMNFIPVTQKVGPDGSLYVSDWSDKQVCHRGSGAVELWDRSNGRIYKVSYVGAKDSRSDGILPSASTAGSRRSLHQAPFDLNKLSDLELAKMAVEDTNEFFVRMARRVLSERSSAGTLDRNAKAGELSELSKYLLATEFSKENSGQALRALWVLASVGNHGGDWRDHISNPEMNEHLKAWGLRGLYNEGPQEAGALPFGLNHYEHLVKLCAVNTTPLVRRELASLLQRLPLDKRTDIAAALLKHGEDKDDHNIPLLIWYGIEPLVGEDANAAMRLAAASKIDQVTTFIYRRLSADEKGRAALLAACAGMKDEVQRAKTLEMILQNSRTAGKLTMPKEWPAIAAKLGAESAVVNELSALFGDAGALKRFRTVLADAKADSVARERALGVLLQARDLATARVLQILIEETPQPTPLRRKAIQSLAALPDTETAGVLINRYKGFSGEEKVDAIGTLASTRDGGSALLQAVIAKKVDVAALTPFVVRQLQSLENKEIDGFLEKAIGTVNKPKGDLAALKAKYQKMLAPAKLKGADLAAGKVTFMATCGTCHKLLGEGANVGPDLTGSNRGNLDYLLDNVLDPNAVIGKDYQLNLFSMKDGRVMSGLVKEETTTTFRTVLPGGLESVLNKSELAKREVAKVSLMPEGQFDAMPPEQVINLVAYLQSGAPKTVGANAPDIKVEGAIEGETMKVLSKTGGSAKNQKMGGFRASRWSGNDHLWWTGGKVGDVLTLALPVGEKGRYSIKGVFTKARDYGIMELSLDGKPLSNGPIDFFNVPDVVTSGELDFGQRDLEAGEHKLEVKIVGSNPQAVPGRMFGLDYLKLEKK